MQVLAGTPAPKPKAGGKGLGVSCLTKLPRITRDLRHIPISTSRYLHVYLYLDLYLYLYLYLDVYLFPISIYIYIDIYIYLCIYICYPPNDPWIFGC